MVKSIYVYVCVFCDIWCLKICIGIVCRYFVGHGSCMLCEAWNLKIYDEYVWVFCEEGVCKIYESVR